MPFTIKPLYISTSSLQGHCTDKPTTMQHPDLMRWCKRYNTTDTSTYRGKRTTTLYVKRRDNPYHKAKEAIVTTIRTRIDKLIRKAQPDYQPIKETMFTKGDKLSSHRHQLLLSVGDLCDAIVDGKWRSREASFYHINTHYLAIMRELYGATTVYRDHKNVACSDHFIPENERRYGKRKPKRK